MARRARRLVAGCAALMPVEFALRPRIRLREGFTPPRRRWRLRLPRFTLHVLAYWAGVAGICYTVVRFHDAAAARSMAETPLLAEPQAPAPREPQAPAPSAPSEPQAPAPSAPSEPHAVEPARGAPAGASGEPPLAGTPPVVRSEPALAEKPPMAELEPPLAVLPPLATIAPALRSPPRAGSALPSCESAAASSVLDLDFSSSDRTADLASSVIAGVLENGAWLSTCNVPASTHLGVCVAIKHGQVKAATVIVRPADAGLQACVEERAAALQFPYSNRLDIARTQF